MGDVATTEPRELDCRFPGCDGIPMYVGLCTGHIKQRKRGGPLKPLRRHVVTLDVLTGRPDGCPRCDLYSGSGLCLVCQMELSE